MEENRTYKISIWRDEEAGVWIAHCSELYMILEGEDLSALIDRSYIVAEEMINLNNLPSIARLSFFNKGILEKWT